MIKKYFLLIVLVVLLSGCNSDIKISLNDNLYNTSEFIQVTKDDINNLEGNYILYTYNGYCSFSIPCEDIFREFMDQYSIGMYSINFSEFKETYLYDTVKYAPSIIIVSNKKIIAYLDANSDDDLDKYQDVNAFEEWILEYVNQFN